MMKTDLPLCLRISHFAKISDCKIATDVPEVLLAMK